MSQTMFPMIPPDKISYKIEVAERALLKYGLYKNIKYELGHRRSINLHKHREYYWHIFHDITHAIDLGLTDLPDINYNIINSAILSLGSNKDILIAEDRVTLVTRTYCSYLMTGINKQIIDSRGLLIENARIDHSHIYDTVDKLIAISNNY